MTVISSHGGVSFSLTRRGFLNRPIYLLNFSLDVYLPVRHGVHSAIAVLHFLFYLCSPSVLLTQNCHVQKNNSMITIKKSLTENCPKKGIRRNAFASTVPCRHLWCFCKDDVLVSYSVFLGGVLSQPPPCSASN